MPPFPTKSPVTTFLTGFLYGGRKILEDGTTFRWGFIHSEILVCVSILLRRFVFRMVSHRVERKTRVTGDEAPSFARKFSSRERSGCEAGSVWCLSRDRIEDDG